MVFGAIGFAVLLGVVQASFFEWAFHRFWLHKPWLPPTVFTAHTLVHHQLCKHEDTFHVTEEEQEEALHFQWWGGPFLVFLNCLPWLVVALVLRAQHVALPYAAFLIPFASTFLFYYIAYEGLHYLMHKPRWPWLENSSAFQFIKHHHRIHHDKMDKNLNVVLPLADFCLGSLVLERPANTPTVTSPMAKRTARKYSRWGRRLREGAQPEQVSPASPPEHAAPTPLVAIAVDAAEEIAGGTPD